MRLQKLSDWLKSKLAKTSTHRARRGSNVSRQTEICESRCLLAVTLSFDYSLDTNNFFADSTRKTLLESAGAQLTQRLNDSLNAITVSGGNTWTASFNHPATGVQTSKVDLSVPADTLIVFAGGRNLGSTLGIGGPGGFSASGTQAFLTNVQTRGETGAGATPKTDFGPWGGSITFNTTATWHFGATTSGLDSNEADFFSVAMHELGHLLGIGTAGSWNAKVSNGTFTGSAAQAEYDLGGPVPLSSDDSHWEDGTLDGGKETAMDPVITNGTRKVFTELDFAGLKDVGWEVTAPPVSFQRTFTLSNGVSHTVVVSDSGTSNDGESQIVIDGVTTVFTNPSSALIIEGGDQADSITINGLDSGFVASITINGNGGNDAITANADLGSALTINGGAATDSVSISGSAATAVDLIYATTTSGTLEITGGSGKNVTLANIESLTDSIVADTRSYTLLAAAETVTLGDDGVTAGVSRLAGASLALPVNFANPLNALTLNTGDGNDVITVGPLDSSLAAAIAINGEGNNDSILAAAATLPLTLTGGNGLNTIVGGSGADTIVGGPFEDTITGGPGADNIDPGTGFDWLIETFDANITLTPTSLTTTPPGGGASTADVITGFDRVNITGGPSGNVIDLSAFVPSTSFPAVIVGGGGRDSIVGTNRADSIDCSASTVQVTVNSGTGNDTVTTGSSHDRISTASGDDIINSGAGNDTIDGGSGNDTMDSGAGDDSLLGQTGNDSIIAGDGDDRIQSGAGTDFINCGNGADRAFGGTENDSILGGAGADSLFGDAGDDTVKGEGDNDQISGFSGIDSLDGGAGIDRVSETADTNIVITGLTMVSAFLGTETHVGIERYNLNGGDGANLIDVRLSGVFAIVHGNGGNDTLLGSAFADQIFGDAGTDVISGGAGVDILDAGDSLNDVFYEKADSDFTITPTNGGFVVVSAATGNETVLNFEKVAIVGGSGANRIDCSALTRNCTLLGGGGNDTLLGGSVADILIGGSRADANGGTDSLDGGGAIDTYDNDAADTRVVASDIVSATAISLLPSWLDFI